MWVLTQNKEHLVKVVGFSIQSTTEPGVKIVVGFDGSSEDSYFTLGKYPTDRAKEIILIIYDSVGLKDRYAMPRR